MPWDTLEHYLELDSVLVSGGAQITFGSWKLRSAKCCRQRESQKSASAGIALFFSSLEVPKNHRDSNSNDGMGASGEQLSMNDIIRPSSVVSESARQSAGGGDARVRHQEQAKNVSPRA